jgi:hypothetical protein
MPDFSVIRVGTDTSGRPIYSTAFFEKVWQHVLARPMIQPFRDKIVVVQGGFMSRVSGGGASASAGYHDLGGCRDVRTWNLTKQQQAILWWEMALAGIYFWPRDAAHGGMDPHGHCIAGWDKPLASGAAYQWQQAENGRDGLAGNGPDYVSPRPEPFVKFPPTEYVQEDDMFTPADSKKLDQIVKKLDNERTRDQKDRERDKARQAKLVALIGGVVDTLTEYGDAGATKDQVAALRKRLLDELRNDPDVDGADNPAPQA